MNSKADSLGPVLQAAQALEDNHHWMQAFDLRAEAVNQALSRPSTQPAPRPANPSNELEPLAAKHKPSKIGHDYIEPYWRELRELRQTATRVLEIGVQTPRSVRMWRDFFPNAQIYGIDIDPRCAKYAEDRIEIFIGDQTDETFLLDVIKRTGGEFDVVIDDGLHTAYSILKSFSYLYPALQPRGIYVIEDIMQLPPVLQFLNQVLTGINYYPDDVSVSDWPALSEFENSVPWVTRHTIGLSIYRYLAFIKRGFNPGDSPNLISKEEFQQRKADMRARIEAYLTELEQRGKATSWDELVDHFGVGQKHHILAVLQQRGLLPETQESPS